LKYDTNLLLAGESVSDLSPAEIANRVTGSKFVFILTQFTEATRWSIKGCLLLLYSRITVGFPLQHLLVKILAGYCVIAYLTTTVTMLAVWCRPISQYWAVPVTNEQCATYNHHLTTTAVFNISADIGIFLIPVSIVTRLKLQTKK
jgi:hypothetical protein